MFSTQFNIGTSRDAIQRAIGALENPKTMFERVRDYVVDSTEERFKTGVGPDGAKWAAKKPSTIEHYKRLGYGPSALSHVLIAKNKRLSGEIIGTATATGAVIGSALIYAGVMQMGAAKGAFGRDKHGRPLPWGTIPARPWLGLSAEDGAAIVEIAEEFIAAALGEGT